MGKRKIEKDKPIQNKNYLKATFSKRRNGMFRKATDLCRLTGAEIAIIAFSPGNKPFRFGHPSADIVINRYLGLPTSCATTDEEGNKVEEEDGCPGSTSGSDDGGGVEVPETELEEQEEGIEELGLAIKDDGKPELQDKILILEETGGETLEKIGGETLEETGGETLEKIGGETLEKTGGGTGTLEKTGGGTLEKTRSGTLEKTRSGTLEKTRSESFEDLEKSRFETLEKFKDEMPEQTDILEETKKKNWWDLPIDERFGVDELKNYRRCLQQLRENLSWKLGDIRMRISCTKDYLRFVSGL